MQNGPSLPSSSSNINSDVPNLPSPSPKSKSWGKRRWLAHKWYHQQQLNFMSTTTNTPPTHEDADFGDVMGPKADGCVWLGGSNIDTFHTVNFNNKKGNLLRAFIRKNELDGFFGQESGLNWDLLQKSRPSKASVASIAYFHQLCRSSSTRVDGCRPNSSSISEMLLLCIWFQMVSNSWRQCCLVKQHGRTDMWTLEGGASGCDGRCLESVSCWSSFLTWLSDTNRISIEGYILA